MREGKASTLVIVVVLVLTGLVTIMGLIWMIITAVTTLEEQGNLFLGYLYLACVTLFPKLLDEILDENGGERR